MSVKMFLGFYCICVNVRKIYKIFLACHKSNKSFIDKNEIYMLLFSDCSILYIL